MKHTHKLELANVKLECVRARGEVERELDAFQAQLEGKSQHSVLFSTYLFILAYLSCFSL